jgi:multidrug efflux system membrane fusion protein
VCVWLVGCDGQGRPAEAAKAGPTPDGKKTGRPSERRYLVRTAPVSTRPLKYEIETTGSLEADDIYRIDAQVPGVVQDVAFKEGDEVTADTVLCRVSPRTYALSAARAKAAWQKAKDAWQKALADQADTERKARYDVERAKLKLSQAERDVGRKQPAFDAHAIPEDDFLAARDRRDLAAIELRDAEQALKTLVDAARVLAQQRESEANQAEVEWQQAEEDLRKSSAVPPVSGCLDRRFVANGAQVSTGAPIAQLVGRGLKLKFTLPEQQVAAVREKEALTFRVMAHAGRDFAATIYHIGDLSDPKTRLVTCWATIESTEATLKPGFFATVRIVTATQGNAVVVPLTAVQPTESGFVAYVLENDVAVRRPVELGLQVADEGVEILKGLQAGETLVVEGGGALQDRVPVRDVQEAREEKAAAGAGSPAAEAPGAAGRKAAGGASGAPR